VDVLLGQFSGANWYPVVYEYSESYGRSLAAAKRLRGLERLAYAAEQFGAAVTIPCSGPAAFLDPVLFHNNDVSDSDDNPFPMMDTAAKFLESRGCPAFLTMPGDIIEARDGSLTLESRSMSDREVYGDREKYLRNYAERKRPVIDGCLRGLKTEPLAGEILKQEFVRILRSSKVLVEQIKGVVRFQLLGVQRGDIVLDCAEGKVPTIRDYTGEDVNYRFTVDHRFVHDVLKGRFINFESVFLGMRFTAWRNPDVFNDALFTILVNFDDTRLQQADREFQCESAASGGVFEVVNDGACYLVQRRCPHMGSDLSVVGQVSGGMITCARHGWQFRLSDGACVNVSAPPIFVQHKTMSDRSSDCL
jgi:UDP-MurNAc hydroxylase